MVTEVEAETDAVVTLKATLVAPAGTLILAGVAATPVLLLESTTSAPPDGAALVNVTVPFEEVPPVTVEGLTESVESAAAPDAGGVAPRLTSKLRTADHAPSVPPALRPRTRHQQRLSEVNVWTYCVCVSPACEPMSGAVKRSESSI
jgi:hypothetical protein